MQLGDSSGSISCRSTDESDYFAISGPSRRGDAYSVADIPDSSIEEVFEFPFNVSTCYNYDFHCCL